VCLRCSCAEVEERGGDFLDDLFHLTVRRMKGGEVVGTAPFNGIRQHLRLARVHQMTAEGIVVGCARRRVQTDRLLHSVHTAPHRLNGIAHAIG